MLEDLIADGQCLLRRSGHGVKDDAGRDARQAAHDEPFPYASHVPLPPCSVALLSWIVSQRLERELYRLQLPAVPAGFTTGSGAPGDAKSDQPGDEHNDSHDPKRVRGESESAEDEGDQKYQQN
jgi:hypothetical protein